MLSAIFRLSRLKVGEGGKGGSIRHTESGLGFAEVEHIWYAKQAARMIMITNEHIVVTAIITVSVLYEACSTYLGAEIFLKNII